MTVASGFTAALASATELNTGRPRCSLPPLPELNMNYVNFTEVFGTSLENLIMVFFEKKNIFIKIIYSSKFLRHK